MAQRSVFAKAYRPDVTILYGTAASVLPHTTGDWQFKIMVELGMALMDAKKSSTLVGAKHMRMSREVGATSIGLLGNIIAVRVNPLHDQNLLRNVDVAIKGGDIIKIPAPSHS